MPQALRHVLQPDFAALTERDGSLDGAGEFAHIAGEVVLTQPQQGGLIDCRYVFVLLQADAPDEMCDQQIKIIVTIT